MWLGGSADVGSEYMFVEVDIWLLIVLGWIGLGWVGVVVGGCGFGYGIGVRVVVSGYQVLIET